MHICTKYEGSITSYLGRKCMYQKKEIGCHLKKIHLIEKSISCAYTGACLHKYEVFVIKPVARGLCTDDDAGRNIAVEHTSLTRLDEKYFWFPS